MSAYSFSISLILFFPLKERLFDGYFHIFTFVSSILTAFMNAFYLDFLGTQFHGKNESPRKNEIYISNLAKDCTPQEA